MSTSKFIMAKKLSSVQETLMGEVIEDMALDSLIKLIFKACHEQNLCFWFNVFENEIVLNLRDIGHENYELNIRQHYTDESIDDLKKQVLINAFLITTTRVSTTKKQIGSQKEMDIISGDKPVPKHIRDAINKIESKGVPVTVEAIKNHLPLGQMSTNSRIECNNYLKQMEAQQ